MAHTPRTQGTGPSSSTNAKVAIGEGATFALITFDNHLCKSNVLTNALIEQQLLKFVTSVSIYSVGGANAHVVVKSLKTAERVQAAVAIIRDPKTATNQLYLGLLPRAPLVAGKPPVL